MKRLLAAVLFLLIPSTLYAQVVINPTRAEFVASADHNVVEHEQPLVTSYELRIYQVNGTTPIRIDNLGKPAPDAANKIVVPITTIIAQLAIGDYFGRVAAKGPGGETVSEVSNPFTVTIRAPSAPTSLIFTK